MAMKKLVNYSDEQAAELAQRYEAGESVESLAESLGRAKRSVISKLAAMKVYVAAKKASAAKHDEGPTKKELFRNLEQIAPFAVDTSLMNATKAALESLIAYVAPHEVQEAETDSDMQDVA